MEPAGRPRRGADVGKRKTYIVLEPVEYSEASFNALVRRGNRGEPRVENALDAYRLLASYSFRPKHVFLELYHKLQGENPGLVSEAVELARALSQLEDAGDPDRLASERILEYLGKSRREDGGGLMRYV